MKKLIYNAVTTDAGLIAIVPADRVLQRYVLGERAIPDNMPLPFLLISELPAFVPNGAHETSKALTHYFQFYMYDKVGSYGQIEDYLDMLVDVIRSLEGQTSSTGKTCMEVRWQSRSQDYADDAYDAFVKHDTFKVTGSTKH